MTVTIRRIEPRDEARWRQLWDAYTRFYDREPVEAVTRYTWARLMDPASPLWAIVAECDSAGVIAIANCVMQENTSTLTPGCYLSDLYVDPAQRASGVGRTLITWLVTEAKAKGWARVYWHTKENNYRARGLYDQFTSHSGFLRYVINL